MLNVNYFLWFIDPNGCLSLSPSPAHSSILHDDSDSDSVTSPNHKSFPDAGDSITSSEPLPVIPEGLATTRPADSFTADKESAEFGSARSLLAENVKSASADGGMVFENRTAVWSGGNGADVVLEKYDSISSDPSETPAPEDHQASAVVMTTKSKLVRQKTRFDETCTVQSDGDPSHQGRGMEQEYQPVRRNHVWRHLSPERSDRTPGTTSSVGGNNKKQVTLADLRLRKKKLSTEIAPPLLEEGALRGALLSGSLECLVDAVSPDNSGPNFGELNRSISLFDMLAELNEREVSPFSDTSTSHVSVQSTRYKVQSDCPTSDESLQKLGDDSKLGDGRTRHDNLQGLSPDHQKYPHIHNRPVSNKSLEHRHTMATIQNDKHRHLLSHHTRNKSDTAMLPSLQHSEKNSRSSVTSESKGHSSSSHSLLHSLQEHLKQTISMPNVFRRERSSKPVISELRAAQITKPSDPVGLLIQYQFLSLRCCTGLQSRLELRKLIQEGSHNTEGQNYKLSFEREPNQ